jgi:hypothetical protein
METVAGDTEMEVTDSVAHDWDTSRSVVQLFPCVFQARQQQCTCDKASPGAAHTTNEMEALAMGPFTVVTSMLNTKGAARTHYGSQKTEGKVPVSRSARKDTLTAVGQDPARHRTCGVGGHVYDVAEGAR